MNTQPMIDAARRDAFVSRAIGGIASACSGRMVRWLRHRRRAPGAALCGRPVDHADLKVMLDAAERDSQWRL